MVYGEDAIEVRYFSDSPLRYAPCLQALQTRCVINPSERNSPMATKICGFPSRRWAAFFLGVLIGTIVVGCSMFGPGIGASVY